MDVVFLCLATAATLAGIGRELPLQYVLTVTAIMYVIAAFACWAFREPSWVMPWVHTLSVLNSRGVSRLILLKWQDRPYYGWWLMGLTCCLTLALYVLSLSKIPLPAFVLLAL